MFCPHRTFVPNFIEIGLLDQKIAFNPPRGWVKGGGGGTKIIFDDRNPFPTPQRTFVPNFIEIGRLDQKIAFAPPPGGG